MRPRSRVGSESVDSDPTDSDPTDSDPKGVAAASLPLQLRLRPTRHRVGASGACREAAGDSAGVARGCGAVSRARASGVAACESGGARARARSPVRRDGRGAGGGRGSAARRGHRGERGVVGGGDGGDGRRARWTRPRVRRGATPKLLRRSAAGPPCAAQFGDGLLPVRERRGGRALRAEPAWPRARTDRRLGRAPRQRDAGPGAGHAGHPLRLDASMAVVSRDRRGEGPRPAWQRLERADEPRAAP